MRPIALMVELRRVAGSVVRSVYSLTARLGRPWRRRQRSQGDGTPEGVQRAMDLARTRSRQVLANQIIGLHRRLGGPDATVSVTGRIDRKGPARVPATLTPDRSVPGAEIRDDRFHACVTSEQAEEERPVRPPRSARNTRLSR